MEKNLEKSLKRFLKRKVKITLGFIVTFLLSCNFISAEGLYIQNNANTNEIEFSQDDLTWGKNPYGENEFKDNTYTINGELKTDRVSLVNFANRISLINNGGIIVESTDGAWGIDNSGTLSKIENNEILNVVGVNNTTGIGNYDGSKIEILENNGSIITKSLSGNTLGINNQGSIIQIKNNNLIQAKGIEEVKGIENYGIDYLSSQLEILINNGNIIVESNICAWGINNDYAKNGILENNGKIEVKGIEEVYGISYIKSSGEKIINNGEVFTVSNIKGKVIKIENTSINYILNKGLLNISSIDKNAKSNLYFTGIDYINASNTSGKVEIHNIGTIKSCTQSEVNTKGIGYSSNILDSTIENRGNILSYSDESALGIYVDKNILKNLKNDGIIYAKGTHEDTSALSIGYNGDIAELKNNGIIGSNNLVIRIGTDNAKMEKIINNGLFVGGLVQDFLVNNKNYLIDRIDDFNKGFVFKVENGKYIDIHRADNNDNVDIINASLISNGEAGTQSIAFENQNQTEKIYNGITDTLTVKGTSSLTDGVVNGYTNAVVFDEAGGELTLNNTVINGGIAKNSFAVFGNKGTDKLSLSGESIINGNINLGKGTDTLSLAETVQINGILNGGDGTDTLNFGISKDDNVSTFAENEKSSLNILYDIAGFENTTVGTKVTIFEKTISDTGDIKNLTAQLGDITIGENGELTLRIDGTEKADGKVTGHALYENIGSITAENGGKLTLNTFGFGKNEVIDFKNTDLSKLKDEDIKLSSVLHKGKVGENNTITVLAKKDLKDLDIANYEKLNKIYHSILNSENVDKFTVEEEQFGVFTKYLHDIYAPNPYAYSSELSRKTMSMMKNLADKDLKPDYKEWAIYGGFTHTDGETENSYYGKGYYTYDIGSRDISADTKISGGYFKAEYGKSEDVTTGIIFGGNNSETEIGASKVEGDSFYFGTYAKKYLNNFRFTLGAGFQHGDYKADRTAIGYDRITETRKYDSNYHDRGFNIYADTKYSKELGNGFYFEPSLTLEYSYVDQDGANEDGVLAIETDSKNFDYLSGAVNLDLRKEIKKDKFTHSLIAGVSYERMLSGYDEEYITGRIKGGTDFDILVPEKEKDIFSLNAKYELETEKGFIFDVKGSYRFEHDTDKDEWVVGTGIGYRF